MVEPAAETKRTLLVVDDNKDTRDLLGIRLGKLNYEVIAVSDKTAALDALAKHGNDLLVVFLDLCLRGGSEQEGIAASLSLIDEIKKASPYFPVIAYSAYGIGSGYAVEAVKRGASWYIDKVQSRDEEFAVVIENVLRTWELVGKLVDSERQREFLQNLIDRLPIEVMVRDKDLRIHLENETKSKRFGGPLPTDDLVKCCDRYENGTCIQTESCPCAVAFRDGRPDRQYYTWRGIPPDVPGAELLIQAAPLRKDPGGEELAVETVQDVSCQVGFQILMREILALPPENKRQAILEAVVKHFVGEQVRGIPPGEHGSQAQIGFTRARAYLVTPRGGEVFVLQKAAGLHEQDLFSPEPVAFDESSSPWLGSIWENVQKGKHISRGEMKGKVEAEAAERIGDSRADRVWIPIRVGHQPEGVIVADKLGKKDRQGNSDETITWEEVHWCQVLSEHLSGVFETVYQLEGRQWLLETEKAMAEADSVENMYRAILGRTKEYFDADCVSVCGVTEEKRWRRLVCSSHDEPPCTLRQEDYPLERGINARAIRTNTPQFVKDCASDDAFQTFTQNHPDSCLACPRLKRKGITEISMAAIPFGPKDRVEGTIFLVFSPRRGFDSIDQDLLKSLGASLSIAFAGQKAHMAEQAALNRAESLATLYKTAASETSEERILWFWLTYLTAGSSLAFNRALFFRYVASDRGADSFRFERAIGQMTHDEFKSAAEKAEDHEFETLLDDPPELEVEYVALNEKLRGMTVNCESPLGEIMNKNAVTLVSEPFSDALLQDSTYGHLRDDLGMQRFYVVGIKVDNRPFGAFVVDRAFAGGFRPIDNGKLEDSLFEAQTMLESLVEEKRENERIQEIARAKSEKELGHRAAQLVLHNVNQPLSIIRDNVELLEATEKAIPSSIKQALATIDRQCQRIKRIRSDFMNLFREIPEEFAEVDVPRLILSCTKENVPEGIVVDIQCSRGCGRARLNSSRLRVCLEVLLRNAADAVEGISGQKKVQVILRDSNSDFPEERQYLGKSGIAIDVIDSGQGVAPEVRENLFVPFKSRKKSGLGIGLALSREIARAGGGDIYFAAQDTRGTRFTLILPAREEEQEPSREQKGEHG